MGSVVSAIIGGQAQQNVAGTQAAASNYQVDVGKQLTEEQLAQQASLAGSALTEQQSEFGGTLGEQKSEFGANLGEKQREYNTTQGIGNTQLANSAAGINAATSSAPAELLQEQKDIQNKSSREMQNIAGQVGANLATQGVRGGQAATLQNRAVGEAGTTAQDNIDQLLAEDAEQRRAAQTGYYTTIGSGAMGKV